MIQVAGTEQRVFGGKVVALSERSDIDFDINETLIVELYSK